jgi:hypothetical protein
MIIVNLVNCGGGRHITTTKNPSKQPSAVLTRTLTGINHQSRKFLRVMLSPNSVNIRHGKNKANTSLLRSLNVALGINCIVGFARSSPMTVKQISFNKGTIAVVRSAAPDLILISNKLYDIFVCLID